MKRLRVASSLSRIYLAYKNHDTGTISASRMAEDCGTGRLYSKSELASRNKDLRAYLISKGFGVTSIDGAYIENYGSSDAVKVKEQSLYVVDLKDSGRLKATLMELGGLYEQDSITFAKAGSDYYLVSTNECPSAYPGEGKVGVELKLGKPYYGGTDGDSPSSMRDLGQFFSQVRGRGFVFKDIKVSSLYGGKIPANEMYSHVQFAKRVQAALDKRQSKK